MAPQYDDLERSHHSQHMSCCVHCVVKLKLLLDVKGYGLKETSHLDNLETSHHSQHTSCCMHCVVKFNLLLLLVQACGSRNVALPI